MSNQNVELKILMPNGEILPYTEENYAATFPTAEEIADEMNRRRRDDEFMQTDMYALSDRVMSAEMIAYRQALRDITAHENWPELNEEDWPVRPEN